MNYYCFLITSPVFICHIYMTGKKPDSMWSENDIQTKKNQSFDSSGPVTVQGTLTPLSTEIPR